MFRKLLVTTVLLTIIPACAQPHPWRLDDPAITAINRGVALMDQYRYAEAVTAFETAVELAPNLVEARIDLALALLNRQSKEDFATATTLVDEIIAGHPDEVRALYLRGIMHQYAGEDEPAIELFERVVQLEPHDAYGWYFLGLGKLHLDQPARAELERAVQENPNLASAHHLLARAAVLAGDREAAKRHNATFLKLRESPLAELIVAPYYRRVGPLAFVRPVTDDRRPAVTGGELQVESTRPLFTASEGAVFRAPGRDELAGVAGAIRARNGMGIALADFDEDGRLDLVTTALTVNGRRRVALLRGTPQGALEDGTTDSGLAVVDEPLACACGDYDNDGHVDLFVACAGTNALLRGRGDGTFEDVTAATGVAGPAAASASAIFVDADHDGDLDLYVCNATSLGRLGPIANQLLNNNSDGTFTDIAVAAGVACAGRRSVMVAPADLDGDRDTDLVVFNDGAPIDVFMNDRLGEYHPELITTSEVHGPAGGVAQDFNGDGRADLLVFAGAGGAAGGLYLSGGAHGLEPRDQFAAVLDAVATWGVTAATRVADVDLDGDLDIALFGSEGHLLLNDGRGHFVLRAALWPADRSAVLARGWFDLTEDGVPDLVRVTADGAGAVELVPTELTPPAGWLAITPTGERGVDGRTRSPASGFGTRLVLQCGVHRQVVTYTGQTGSFDQSLVPLVFGLDGATKANFLSIVWPDGVSQAEQGLASQCVHRIAETERRVSSCPVLFAWNGDHFEFIGDFAGVGGLGYFVAPGEYAPPRARELVRVAPDQLRPRDGRYELRVCEPMEEVAYLDRLELLAIDHPADRSVFPDERLAVAGDPPTQELLCPDAPLFPVTTRGPDDDDGADLLTEVDRIYAYSPPVDRRFFGFCAPHELVLEFGPELGALAGAPRVFLFVTGSIEYPYSQTTFAAQQAGVSWEPLSIDRSADGRGWETIVADGGAPGGMGRTIAIPLGDALRTGDRWLRIRTNLEIYYDRIFVARDRGVDDFAVRSVPPIGAELRYLGFPREYTPDRRLPTIYSYDSIEPTSAFKTPAGRYTRYGDVAELLREFDDRHVVLGTGDEIAIAFDANALPPPGPGMARSFVLISHAYCKDMDLYTAEPDTVAPLPFGAMSEYPYPATENYPRTPAHREYQERYNTRIVE